MTSLPIRWLVALLLTLLTSMSATADDTMLQGVDLNSPAMTQADVTRAEVVKILSAASPERPADLTSMHLSGLDLSGLDFSGAVLRDARLNKTSLRGCRFVGAVLDQAWLMNADLTGADMKGASLYQAQLIGAKLDDADLSDVRAPANFTRSSLKAAKLVNADLGADMKNQSMGLIRGVLNNADLDGANLTGANLNRVDFEFASLRGTNLTGANLTYADLGGADLTGARIGDANFRQADLDSAKLISLVGADDTNLDQARNLKAAIRD